LMFFNPRMIRRALHGEIERDLDPMGTCRGDETAKVVERSKFGVDACMSAGLGADRIGAARVLWLRNERVVTSFAVRCANGMDGRKVKNIKTKIAHIGQAIHNIFESSVAAEIARLRSREKLIPA